MGERLEARLGGRFFQQKRNRNRPRDLTHQESFRVMSFLNAALLNAAQESSLHDSERSCARVIARALLEDVPLVISKSSHCQDPFPEQIVVARTARKPTPMG
jgi:hypothetical protein